MLKASNAGNNVTTVWSKSLEFSKKRFASHIHSIWFISEILTFCFHIFVLLSFFGLIKNCNMTNNTYTYMAVSHCGWDKRENMSKFELEIVKLKVFNANVYNMYAQRIWIAGISMKQKIVKQQNPGQEDNKPAFIIMRCREIAKRVAKHTKQLKAKCGSFSLSHALYAKYLRAKFPFSF